VCILYEIIGEAEVPGEEWEGLDVVFGGRGQAKGDENAFVRGGVLESELQLA